MIQGIFYARFLPKEGRSPSHNPQRKAISPSLPPSHYTPHIHPYHVHVTPRQQSSDIHTTRSGPRIVAQTPSNLLGAPKTSLLDFDHLQPYIIPRKPFCNRLVTATDSEAKYVVVSHPVLISDEKYSRNEFMFNFGVVIEEGTDRVAFERVVRRLAVTFSEMEMQDGYLSGQEGEEGTAENKGREGRRGVDGLLEIVREDLNNYGECMIPVGEWRLIPCLYMLPPSILPLYTP